MESITNAAIAAKNTIWPAAETPANASGTEPVSGEAGKGTASDPYDKGNGEGQPGTAVSSSSDTTSKGPTTDLSSSSDTTSKDHSTGLVSSSDTASKDHTAGPVSSSDTASKDPTSDVSSSSNPASKGPSTTTAGAAAPDSGAALHQKQQGADRPAEEPGSENIEAIKDKKENAEKVQEEGSSSTEPSGDGPKLLSEVKGQGSKNPGGTSDEDLGSTSKEPGTGKQYVKSSGVEADGGDFDATKPGAAKEADRILEEKGIKHDGVNQQNPPGFDSKADKPSLGSKIKDKLHIGKK